MSDSLEVKKAVARVLTERNPLPVEMLVEPDKRRTCSVEIHQQFRESIITRPTDHFDEIDNLVAMPDPPNKRSEGETSRVLSILDELERGNG